MLVILPMENRTLAGAQFLREQIIWFWMAMLSRAAEFWLDWISRRILCQFLGEFVFHMPHNIAVQAMAGKRQDFHLIYVFRSGAFISVYVD